MRTSTLSTSTGPSTRQRKRAANQEAGDKAEQGKNTEARQRRRAANQEAGDEAEQGKNTEARQMKRSANQEAGGKAERGKNTEARQRKRAEIRERAKTGIQPYASARPIGTPFSHFERFSIRIKLPCPGPLQQHQELLPKPQTFDA